MNSKGSAMRNIVLISQVSINVMVPTFLCVAIGVWLDGKFNTWFTVPLLFLGMAAGARNAYVLLMEVVKNDEKHRRKQQEEDIKRKVERANQKGNNERKTDSVK